MLQGKSFQSRLIVIRNIKNRTNKNSDQKKNSSHRRCSRLLQMGFRSLLPDELTKL